MIEQPTTAISEYTKNMSDTQQESMNLGSGLGNAAPVQQNVGEEPKKQQGNYEQDLDKYNRELEMYLNQLDELDKYAHLNPQENFEKLSQEQKDELYKKDPNNYYHGREKINNSIADLRNKINNIKTNKDYDSRTDQQKREDTAYQRAAKDMGEAGLNKGLMFGGGGAAGSSGGGSKDENEDEKRRKRKKLKEELERAKRLKEKQTAMQIIGGLTGIASMTGSAAIHAGGRKATAQVYANSKKPKENKPAWLNEYLEEIENMG